MTPVYTLQSVGKAYGSVRALDRISLDIEDQEVLGVIGRSGAGKTTLLKLLSGLELPTTGRLHFLEKEVNRQTAGWLRKRATMLFQAPLFLRGDVYTNASYGLRIRGLPVDQIDEKVSEAINLVRLGGLEGRQARSLSGGEQQRVALARALVLDPSVLLLDEPTSNLDPANASIMADIIGGEAKRRCIVIATHDYEQVKRLAQRIVFLEGGRVVEEGSVEKIFSGSRMGGLENVFIGESSVVEGISQIDIGGGVKVVATFDKSGRVVVHVRSEDIILSKGWVETSARNQYRGRIIAVEEIGPVVKLKIDVGRTFTVQITKKSFNEMGLNLGLELYLSFKASSVQLI